jgi:hypothetical protein
MVFELNGVAKREVLHILATDYTDKNTDPCFHLCYPWQKLSPVLEL